MAVDFGKQYGPLPLGAWVALVGGGLGIAWYTSRNKGGTVITEDTSGYPGVGDGAVSTWIQTQPPAAEESVAQKPTTNEEWAKLAINFLIAQGYDPALSDTAIRKYLESTELSLSENALVKIALAKLGSPPVPLPIPPPLPQIPSTPTPAPTPSPSPAPAPSPGAVPSPTGGRWVTVTRWPSRLGTLWGISQQFYGNGREYMRIYNANRRGVLRPDGTYGTLYNPNLIWAGMRLYVP